MEEGLRPPPAPRDGVSVTAIKDTKSPNLKLRAMLGLVLGLVLVVVLLLPSMVDDPESRSPAPATETQTEVVAGNLPELPVIDHFRADAEQALQNFLRMQARPDLHNAEIWAYEDWQRAFSTAASGDDEFGQGNFAAALGAYEEAGAALKALVDNREQILQQSLTAGWKYLQEDTVNDASRAFERVLAMQPGHQDATLGLARSAVREQVLSLVINARQAEISNALPLAAETYGLALQLDPLYLPVREALEKVAGELRKRAFQDSMGRALQGIERGQYAVAEKALVDAAGINPGHSAIKDARERLLSARRQDRLTALRSQAEQFESTENWEAARQAYVQALAIDSQAAFGRNGLARVQQKLALHQQLDHYLADTTRLFSDDPLNNARELLAVHHNSAANEPLLEEKLVRLEHAVRLAIIPVGLLIISDNLTEITIYKIGRLGRFEQKQVSLRPGKYTITGSRQGYRDVLKVIELKPGGNGQSVDIRTREQI